MNTNVMTAPKRLSKIETAARLDVPLRAVDRLIEAGELRTVRVGRLKAVVLESSVNDLIRRMAGDEKQAG